MGNLERGTDEWKSFIKFREAAELSINVGGQGIISVKLEADDYQSLAVELHQLSMDLRGSGMLVESFTKTTETLFKRDIFGA